MLMSRLIVYLKKLKFIWVAIANALLLLAGQIALLMMDKQSIDYPIIMSRKVIESSNSTLLWYLVLGIGFYLFYRYKEKETGYTGQWLESFWVPLSVWFIGMVFSVLITIKSLMMWL